MFIVHSLEAGAGAGEKVSRTFHDGRFQGCSYAKAGPRRMIQDSSAVPKGGGETFVPLFSLLFLCALDLFVALDRTGQDRTDGPGGGLGGGGAYRRKRGAWPGVGASSP